MKTTIKYSIVDDRLNNVHSHSATQAMKWYRAGESVLVRRYVDGKMISCVNVEGAKQPRKIDKNRAHCKHIAEEIEAYADGTIYRCPDCDEEIRFPDNVGDKFRCPSCETVNDVDDFEQCSVWDYMRDILDVDFTVSRNREYKSCRVLVAFGGPNIYINTASGDVELYWWTDTARYPMSREAINAVDEWAEEYWNL